MTKFRLEKDIMGDIHVPEKNLWGAQTQRALKYLSISQEKIPHEVIIALAQIKRAIATVHNDLKIIKKEHMQAIIIAADEIISGKHFNEFPLTIWQSGSGTQSNMNINEVLANRASELLGGTRGQNRIIHPNDDVNKSQSSNDVFPSAMHIAAVVSLLEKLIPQIIKLEQTLIHKSLFFNNIIKIGRTHLQDATPITLGQEISGWAAMLRYNIINIKHSIPYLRELALGGTAVGTGLNTHPEYALRVAKELSILIGYPFVTSTNKFEALSACNALINSHGTLKGLAVSITKIANDIRWLSSGPRCGLGELIIPSNEPGSSIMPGKINPTQCEVMIMICCQIMSNDMSINIGGASGNFELNMHRPLIIYNFLQSVNLLTEGINNFNQYCVLGIEPNVNRINRMLHSSLMLVTALNPHIGYDKSSEIAMKAYKEDLTLREAALKLGYISEQQFDAWIKPENMIGNT